MTTLTRMRLASLITAGYFAGVSCTGQESESAENVATSRAAIIPLEPPATVEPGTPSSIAATCPGHTKPDQCGSWAGVELQASRLFPSFKHHDEHCLCGPIEFQIPKELPVTRGRSGWDWDKAELSFRQANGKVVECRYRGNRNPLGGHFGIPVGGDKYLLERCSDGFKAGQPTSSDWFELELGHDHPLGGEVEVALRLGEPDVVGGVVQEQVFYASDPRIPGATLHVPRGSAPPFETFSLETLPQIAPGLAIQNAGKPVTTIGYGVDIHADSSDHFAFTPVPGADCPRIELPYDAATLERLLGPGRESSLRADQLTTLAGSASDLAPTGPVTVNVAQKTLSVCVEHLSFYVVTTSSNVASVWDAKLTGPGVDTQIIEAGAFKVGTLPLLTQGAKYHLSLNFKNVASGQWPLTTRLFPVGSATYTAPNGNATVTALSTANLDGSAWKPSPNTNTLTATFPVVQNAFASIAFDITAPTGASQPLNFCLGAMPGPVMFGACFSWDVSTVGGGSTPVAVKEVCDNLDNDLDNVKDNFSVACYDRNNDGTDDYDGSENRGNCQPGTKTCTAGGWSSCTGQVTPKASDPCGNGDEDCDGQTDENGNTYYVDRDGDGLGDPATSFEGCTQPPGYVTNANDTCDQGGVAYYLDADHDGEGDPDTSVVACAQPQDYVLNNNDCCDLDARAKLGQTNWFSEANACESYDYDCVNGASRRYDTTAHEDNCVGDRDTETCFGATVLEANTTECGFEFMRQRCGWNASPKTTGFCVTSSSTVTQECH